LDDGLLDDVDSFEMKWLPPYRCSQAGSGLGAMCGGSTWWVGGCCYESEGDRTFDDQGYICQRRPEPN